MLGRLLHIFLIQGNEVGDAHFFCHGNSLVQGILGVIEHHMVVVVKEIVASQLLGKIGCAAH